MTPAWASLALLVFLICAALFVGNTHLSTTRLWILFIIALLSGAFGPVAISMLGPGHGTSASGEIVYGTDGKQMYTAESHRYWSTVTAADDATRMLGGFLAAICFILLVYRLIRWVVEKRDAIP